MIKNSDFFCQFSANKKGLNDKTLKTLYFTSGEDRARTDDLLTASQAL